MVRLPLPVPSVGPAIRRVVAVTLVLGVAVVGWMGPAPVLDPR